MLVRSLYGRGGREGMDTHRGAVKALLERPFSAARLSAFEWRRATKSAGLFGAPHIPPRAPKVSGTAGPTLPGVDPPMQSSA